METEAHAGTPRRNVRWEVGSHLEHIDTPPQSPPADPPWNASFATCRGALSALVDLGIQELGWRELHVPTYYCPDAYPSPRLPIEILRYPCHPWSDAGPLRAAPGSVVLTTSYYGEPPIGVEGGASVILDATHDPFADWLPTVRADYVVASLRKTLPVPFGAGILAPTGLPVPGAEPLTVDGRDLIARRRAAMLAKSRYLRGESSDPSYYAALVASEAESWRLGRQAADDESARSVAVMPGHFWRSMRTANATTLSESLVPDARLTARPGSYGVVLLLDDHRSRESLRSWLIGGKVYPAILWEQSRQDEDPAGLDFSLRHLVIPTDFRYSADDMVRVADLVSDWLVQPRDG